MNTNFGVWVKCCMKIRFWPLLSLHLDGSSLSIGLFFTQKAMENPCLFLDPQKILSEKFFDWRQYFQTARNLRIKKFGFLFWHQ